MRYLLWIRLSRVRKVTKFFKDLEKDIRISYEFTRIVKLIVVELYCTHTAACIFYYLATTMPAAKEGYTWIGSLKLGDYSYSNFREIDLWTRYTTSLYFAIVTMATVGKLLVYFLTDFSHNCSLHMTRILFIFDNPTEKGYKRSRHGHILNFNVYPVPRRFFKEKQKDFSNVI